MFDNRYGNYGYAIIGAVTGIFIFASLILISMHLRFFPTKFIMFFSKNSLVLFPLHLMALSFVDKIMEASSLDRIIANDLALALFKLLAIVILALVITPSFNRYFPVLCGNYLPKSLKK